MLSIAIAIGATILLAGVFSRLGETTLRLPWAWTVLAFWLLAGADLASDNPPARFLFSASTLCPGMALMGARRPHHHAWQLVVGCLWVVMVQPALYFLSLPSGMGFSIHILRQLFLLALVGIVVVSFLPTRFSFSGICLLAGFAILFGPQLPWSGIPEMEFSIPAAGSCFLAGLVMARLQPRPDRSRCRPADRLWLDFRDTFGTFWALRLADRIQRAADQEGWGFRLGWRGFFMDDEKQPDQPETEALEQYLRNIVRRFASQEWIDSRLAGGEILE
ncbi:MAG: hypothetical protein QGH11_05310 [Pirellulaceae bacterium]|jgi:hypothetical protein|nr:hypothetical protein [Pirellulaceae bacterium]